MKHGLMFGIYWQGFKRGAPTAIRRRRNPMAEVTLSHSTFDRLRLLAESLDSAAQL